MRCWNFFQALKLLTIWSKKPLLWSCKQTFAAVCLFPLEFLLWKFFLTFFIISIETKLKKCNLKLSLIYLCIMLEIKKHLRHNSIFSTFSWALHGILAPKFLRVLQKTLASWQEGQVKPGVLIPKQRNWWAQSCLCWWENKLTFARQSGCESMLAQPPQSEKMMLAMSKIPLFYLHLISNLKNNDKQVQMLPCQPNYGLFLVVNSNFI